MKKTLFAAALATTLLAGGAAFAGQEAPGPMRDPLSQADTDKDGTVTKAELLADVDARFARIDTNHDGKISPEEREAGFAAMRAKMGEGRGFGMGGRQGVNRKRIVPFGQSTCPCCKFQRADTVTNARVRTRRQ